MHSGLPQGGSGCEDSDRENGENGIHRIGIGERIRIATWNCGGLSYTQREICRELKYDILVLTETHDKGKLKQNRTFILSEPAPSEDSFSGVALLLSDKTAKCVTQTGNIGSRIVYARIKALPCNLFIVGIYIPQKMRKVEPFAPDTIKQLDELLLNVNPNDCVVVLGDLNCKLGRNIENLTGKWCIHKDSNKEGELVLDLMRRTKLTAVSTCFQAKRKKSHATYLAKDPRYKPSQIDYILISSRWATAVRDSKVKWGVSCQRWGRHYDHGLVNCVISSRLRENKNVKKPLDYASLGTDDNIRARFEEEVNCNLSKETYRRDDPSESLLNLQQSLTSAATSTLQPRKSTPLRKRHVSKRTRDLYSKRQANFQSLNQTERKETSKTIWKSCREDYREYLDNILTDMEVADHTGNTREVSRLTKLLSGKSSSNTIMPSKDLNGKPILSTEQLLQAWNDFLTKKFTAPDADRNRSQETTVSPEDQLQDDELEKCLKALKTGRAPGWDGIPIEAYKSSPSATAELFRIVRLLWDTEIVPPDLVKGLFIMLYKKKDRNSFSNYRAICLLCHAYKLLSAVLSKRLHLKLEPVLPDSQAGFRPARGTRDNVCILKWTINMLLNESREAVVTFIDYTAAFDTESQLFLDEALSNAGVSPKLRRIIQAIFTAASGCVLIRHPDGSTITSEGFDICRGVLQGDIFSPVAFIVGLWRIFVLHDLPHAGVTVGRAPYEVVVKGLEYADDAGLLDTDAKTASQRVSSISTGSRKDAAMEISISKTKAMHIHKRVRVSATRESEIAELNLKHKCADCNRDFPTSRGLNIHKARWCDSGLTIRSRKGSLADKAVQREKRKEKEKERDHVKLEGKDLDNVYTFVYLGSKFCSDGHDKEDVKYRMDIAQSVFSSLSKIWKDHRLPTSMKLRLYQTAVCSTLTHACEAWDLTDKIKKMINGFNSRCLHVITGKDYRDTATNPDIDLVLLIRCRRLRYLGHILRMEEHRLVRRMLAAYVHGGETIPAGSLLQDCEKFRFEELAIIARDRIRWQQRVKDLQ